ncbi:MAG: hypothetical protein K2N56_05065 [Oscillospiraceae bacterium]|nr:hypothetical protein [Oscillospiraceae bacterium]
MKKRILSVISAVILSAVMMSGCSNEPAPSGSADNSGSATGNSTPGNQSSSDNSADPEEGSFDRAILQSKVTSADSTANSISAELKTCMVEIETRGGTFPEEAAVIEISGNRTEMKVSAPGFKLNKTDTDSTAVEEKIAKDLKEDFNFDYDICALAFYADRDIIGVVYSRETDIEFLKSNFTADNFSSGKYSWSGSVDGTVEGGRVVGTWPRLVNK